MTAPLLPHLRPDRAAQHVLMRRATRASLAVALLLAVMKAAAWVATGSVSMLASMLDSIVDATASSVTLVAVHVSLQPPDREHRFGHGKLEPLAALMQAVLIGVSCAGLVWSAVHRLREPHAVEQGLAGVAVMAVSSVATLLLVRYQRHVIANTGSSAVTADSLHYTSDLLMNLAVALSLLATTMLGWTLVDPLLGLAVAVLVGRSAWRIGHDAVQLLMDREFPDEQRLRIKRLVLAHPEVRGMHDLRTRQSGMERFIQFHLELDGAMPLSRAHGIGDEVEKLIQVEFPDAEVIVHADPEDQPRDGLRFER